MENNRAFGIYAAALFGGVLSVISASVMAGVTTLPGVVTFVEHVSMSLLFRTAYKSFDVNFDPIALLRGWRIERVTATTAAPATPSGSMVGTA